MAKIAKRLKEIRAAVDKTKQYDIKEGFELLKNTAKAKFVESGARFAGTAPDDSLVEEMEIPGHKFYLGVQYHPEFKSRPDRAHPIFRKFIEASKG